MPFAADAVSYLVSLVRVASVRGPSRAIVVYGSALIVLALIASFSKGLRSP